MDNKVPDRCDAGCRVGSPTGAAKSHTREAAGEPQNHGDHNLWLSYLWDDLKPFARSRIVRSMMLVSSSCGFASQCS